MVDEVQYDLVFTVSPTSSLNSAPQSHWHFPMSSNTAQPFTTAVSCLWIHHKSPTSQIVLISTQSSDLDSGATFSESISLASIMYSHKTTVAFITYHCFNLRLNSWHYLINFCLHFQEIPLSTQRSCTEHCAWHTAGSEYILAESSMLSIHASFPLAVIFTYHLSGSSGCRFLSECPLGTAWSYTHTSRSSRRRHSSSTESTETHPQALLGKPPVTCRDSCWRSRSRVRGDKQQAGPPCPWPWTTASAPRSLSFALGRSGWHQSRVRRKCVLLRWRFLPLLLKRKGVTLSLRDSQRGIPRWKTLVPLGNWVSSWNFLPWLP